MTETRKGIEVDPAQAVNGLAGKQLRLADGPMTMGSAFLMALLQGPDVLERRMQGLGPDQKMRAFRLAQRVATAEDQGALVRLQADDVKLLRDLGTLVWSTEGFGFIMDWIDPPADGPVAVPAPAEGVEQ